MHQYRISPILFIIIFLVISLLSGCAISQSKILLDSDGCIDSLSKSVVKIMMEDFLTENIDKQTKRSVGKNGVEDIAIIMVSNQIKGLAKNKELGAFNMSNSKYTYNFLIQKEAEECWLRLYRKEKDDGTLKYEYENTIVFIESEKIDGCFCGGTEKTYSILK